MDSRGYAGMRIEIPGYKTLELKYLVLDYNELLQLMAVLRQK